MGPGGGGLLKGLGPLAFKVVVLNYRAGTHPGTGT